MSRDWMLRLLLILALFAIGVLGSILVVVLIFQDAIISWMKDSLFTLKDSLFTFIRWMASLPLLLWASVLTIIFGSIRMVYVFCPTALVYLMCQNGIHTKILLPISEGVDDFLSWYRRSNVGIKFIMNLCWIPVLLALLFVSLGFMLVMDSNVSLVFLWVLCIPLIISLVTWKLESISPTYVKNILFISDTDRLVTAMRNRVIILSAITVGLTAIAMLLVMMYDQTRMLLIDKLDALIVFLVMAIAIAIDVGFMMIYIDGDTETPGKIKWTLERTHDHYHITMILLNSTLAGMMVFMPFINSAFFAYRALLRQSR